MDAIPDVEEGIPCVTEEAPPGPPTDLAAAHADRYRPGEVVARGGQGCVRRGTDVWLRREVAIKQPVDAAGARRLLQEAFITARLQHPAIVPVYDAGCDDRGLPFYAMKLVEGESLHAAIAASRSLPERLALLPRIIAVAEAVAYAHSRRVIHRDLKPANVLLGAYGETVVVDWGLAKELGPEPAGDGGDASRARAARAGETVEGTVLGTPGYMAPEQARGEAVDARADVYAIGAMLHHLLSGAPRYAETDSSATTGATHGADAGEPPPLPRGVPRDLATIVAKSMSARVAGRYRDAAELAAELHRFQTGQLVQAQVYSPLALLRRWIGRHRSSVTLGAVAMAALILVGAIALRQIVSERDRAQGQQRIAERERTIADQQRATADEQRRAAQDVVDFLLLDLADTLDSVSRLDIMQQVATTVQHYYASVVVDPGDDVAMRRRAKALAILGRGAQARGETAVARRHFQEALAIRAEVAKKNGWPLVADDLEAYMADLAQEPSAPVDPLPTGPVATAAEPLFRGDGRSAPLEIPLFVALWDGADFEGPMQHIVRDEPDLGPGWVRAGRCRSGPNFDDRTSSVGLHMGPDYEAWRARHGGRGPYVILWSEPGFRGSHVTLQLGIYGDLSTYGLDDAVSSVQFVADAPDLAVPAAYHRAPPGVPVMIASALRLHTASRSRATHCREPDQVTLLLQGGEPDIASRHGAPFDGTISWIEVLKGPGYDPRKTFSLFSETLHHGEAIHFLYGVGEVDLGAHGFDDRVRSVRMQK